MKMMATTDSAYLTERGGNWSDEGRPLNYEILDETYERKTQPNEWQPIGYKAASG
jgi:hypothetical protein